jgi:hypothetical protein
VSKIPGCPPNDKKLEIIEPIVGEYEYLKLGQINAPGGEQILETKTNNLKASPWFRSNSIEEGFFAPRRVSAPGPAPMELMRSISINSPSKIRKPVYCDSLKKKEIQIVEDQFESVDLGPIDSPIDGPRVFSTPTNFTKPRAEDTLIVKDATVHKFRMSINIGGIIKDASLICNLDAKPGQKINSFAAANANDGEPENSMNLLRFVAKFFRSPAFQAHVRIYDNIGDTLPGQKPKSSKAQEEITPKSTKSKLGPQSEQGPTRENPNLKAEKEIRGAFHSLFAETLIKNIRMGEIIS